MKKLFALFLSSLLVMCLVLVSCGSNKEEPAKSATASAKADSSIGPTASPTEEATIPAVTNDPNVEVINVIDYSDEVQSNDGWIKRFNELHPDFPYRIRQVMCGSMVESDYFTALDRALGSSGEEAPDIFVVEAGDVAKFTKGASSSYAADLKSLGLDLDTLIKEAEIPQYLIDIGTRGDGSIVGLGFESSPGAFIYRRSIAKKVWGTDDPAVIQEKIGGSWDNFFQAAKDLKKNGYSIVSSNDDIWHILEPSADTPWVVDGKLNIDPKRETFLDLSKKLKDNGYCNNIQSWQEGWYEDMRDEGTRPVFGYFGASWFINYILAQNSESENGKTTAGDWAVCEPPMGFYWGGYWVLVNKNTKVPAAVAEIVKWLALDTSEKGYQYNMANGTSGDEAKVHDTVASVAVMKKSDGKLDFLGGQNMFDVFIAASKDVSGKNITEYDEWINAYWFEQTREYISGKKTREQAIDDFKKEVAENIEIQ